VFCGRTSKQTQRLLAKTGMELLGDTRYDDGCQNKLEKNRGWSDLGRGENTNQSIDGLLLDSF
jgi:hypothetical protein